MERPGENSSQLRFLLTAGKVRDALVLLNTLSTYRFTALYRFDAADLHNLVLVDRENSSAPLMETIPVGQSYCEFVLASREAFVLEDSSLDHRVVDHPKRPMVRSYCGVPLRDAQGIVFGTLCHFDFEATDVPQNALALMEEVASYLDPALAVDALAEGFDHRIDVLRGMLELIFVASTDRQSADDAFEEYAAPIRDGARIQLPADRCSAVESKLRRLKDKLLSMD